MKTKVCHISTVHPLNDNRIFHKECKSLATAGFDVSLVITHDEQETIDGVKIIPLKERKGRLARMTLGTLQALRLALKQQAKIYHFHDPELIPVGIILKLFGKKVIYDVHENTSQQVLNKEYLGGSFRRRAVSIFIGFSESISKLLFNIIIVARPDIADHWQCSKVRVIINAAVLREIDRAPLVDCDKNKIVIIYAGGLTSIRGIKELIQAVGLLDGKVELWLLGKWHCDDFKQQCKRLDGWQYIKYIGYKKVQEVYGYMKKSDIAVVTFLPAPNHLTTLPNKPFEYMACRLPVIMSNFDYWKELFVDKALFVNPKSPDDIKNAIERLLDKPELRKEMGRKGRELVEKKFSWESESQKMIAIYRNLLFTSEVKSTEK